MGYTILTEVVLGQRVHLLLLPALRGRLLRDVEVIGCPAHLLLRRVQLRDEVRPLLLLALQLADSVLELLHVDLPSEVFNNLTRLGTKSTYKLIFLNGELNVVRLLVEHSLVHVRQKQQRLFLVVRQSLHQALEDIQGFLELALLREEDAVVVYARDRPGLADLLEVLLYSGVDLLFRQDDVEVVQCSHIRTVVLEVVFQEVLGLG